MLRTFEVSFHRNSIGDFDNDDHQANSKKNSTGIHGHVPFQDTAANVQGMGRQTPFYSLFS